MRIVYEIKETSIRLEYKIIFNVYSRRLREHGHNENPFFKLFERKELVECGPLASESFNIEN